MGKIGKRLKAANAAFEGKENLTVEEAVALVKGSATAKFDETVEIAVNLGVDPRHADQMVRGKVSLPNGTGKTMRVAVFARGDKADEATKAGADIVKLMATGGNFKQHQEQHPLLGIGGHHGQEHHQHRQGQSHHIDRHQIERVGYGDDKCRVPGNRLPYPEHKDQGGQHQAPLGRKGQPGVA